MTYEQNGKVIQQNFGETQDEELKMKQDEGSHLWQDEGKMKGHIFEL